MSDSLAEYGIRVPEIGSVEGTKPTLPEPLTWQELRKPVDYKNNLLGNRFLERACGLILYGPAGVGKSVAGYQACIEWSAGLPAFHIPPPRPLRIVILQTEDTIDDLREAWAGILDSSVFTPELLALVESNLIVLPPVPGGDEAHFARLLDAAAIKYKPLDIIHPNPLLAFCPRDPTRELGRVLYQVVDPIIKRHQIGFFGVHHTPKMNRTDTSDYGAHDYQYLAAGDARVTNWPRAMIQIEPTDNDGVYCFRLTKRWRRAGWSWEGKPTNERYFKHAMPEVRWLDATLAEVQKAETVEDYTQLLDVLPAASAPGISRDRIRSLAKNKLKVGKDKADSWLRLGIEDKLIERLEKKIPKSKRREALFRRLKEAVRAC